MKNSGIALPIFMTKGMISCSLLHIDVCDICYRMYTLLLFNWNMNSLDVIKSLCLGNSKNVVKMYTLL